MVKTHRYHNQRVSESYSKQIICVELHSLGLNLIMITFSRGLKKTEVSGKRMSSIIRNDQNGHKMCYLFRY